MVDFLLKRPIAVLMAFLALVILGCVTFFTLPVSLLPDIAIPHISVQVRGEGTSARELENTVVSPLRRQLMQVSGLSEICSETRDGSATVALTMDYGVNTDMAFIEVNEKIDAAMGNLPKSFPRPKAVKASATDLPVVYVTMTGSHGDADFIDVSEVAQNMVRRRLEQQPQVAMVDITGVPGKMIRITPDNDLLASAGLTQTDLEAALAASNAEPGSMKVRDGYYEYNIRVSNLLSTPDDVRRVRLMKNGRMSQLGDFCKVELTEMPSAGYSTYGNARAVTMGVIKQQAQSMAAMEEAVDSTLAYFRQQYPQINFAKSRSQRQLLDFTINNLEQNLLLGLILVFVVCALFMRSVRLPVVIGVTVIVAVIITFLLFYLFSVSINIVSLAGLILAVGMMIDNSVIVAENITQFRHRGFSLMESCEKGTNEMITPMLSSSLTTVAVFVPLVFMSGIAGAIFADQAFSITAGLGASYVVGITLMPVLYKLLASKKMKSLPVKGEAEQGTLIRLYDRGIDWIFAHKTITLTFVALSIASIWPLFEELDQERMPRTDSSETMLKVDWNENISLDENRRRCEWATTAVGARLAETSAYIGPQDYLLTDLGTMSTAEADIYLRTPATSQLEGLKDTVSQLLRQEYPTAVFQFEAPQNVFELIFSSSEPPLQARLSMKSTDATATVEKVKSLSERISHSTGLKLASVPLREQVQITVRHDRLALYGVEFSQVEKALKKAFAGSQTTTLRSFSEYVPVVLQDPSRSLEEVLSTTLVKSNPDRKGIQTEIPLSALVTTSYGTDFKTITAAAAGEFVPLDFDISSSELSSVQQSVRQEVTNAGNADVSFTGAIFSNAKMVRELTVILLVSLLMMYFILCAQFESFAQPLIVLLEIPIDVAFALVSLWIFGQSLNIMSAIGIIVTCGIVVNDSILKLDAINELRKSGVALTEAIHTAGRRRLKAILMTSLTTIFAMVPVLFTSDIGSELQRPLAIAMIGSMIVGTLVSIFVIPLVYFLLYRRHHRV